MDQISPEVQIQIIKDLTEKAAADVMRALETPLMLTTEVGGPLAALALIRGVLREVIEVAAAVWHSMRLPDERVGSVTEDDRLAVALMAVLHGSAVRGDSVEAQRQRLHRVQHQFRAVTGAELKIPARIVDHLR